MMPPKARAAFRALLDYEKPPGNGSVNDILQFAEARGFVAHAADWVPYSLGDDQYPQRYEPWAIWLADKGYTPFWPGVRLTAENWSRWSKEPREDAFAALLRRDRRSALDLLMTLGAAEPAHIRRSLLAGFDAGRSFSGMQSADVSVLYNFLKDKAPKVREMAKYKLDNLQGLQSEEANAAKVAQFFTRSDDGSIQCALALHESTDGSCLAHTTFDVLAEVLGISPEDLARRIDLADFRDRLRILILTTASEACRAILAKRLVDAGIAEGNPKLFVAADRDTWEKGLRMTFASVYPSPVFEFLGRAAGTLDTPVIREIDRGWHLGKSVTRELEEGKLPVNTRYDPLRVLALLANKAAAQNLLDEALSLGMAPDNARLSMLRFNLAL